MVIFARSRSRPRHRRSRCSASSETTHFTSLSGQKSTVHFAFLGWGQGPSYGPSFVSLFKTLTPAQIAAGKGDSYLFALNDAISQWGAGIYVRPMAEMNNSGNAWSGFTSSGAPKSGHSPADYRKAFARASSRRPASS